MFDATRREIGERTLVSRRLLALIQSLEHSRTLETAAHKGLIFVQLYGVYEYAVRSAVQAMLSAIRTDGLCARDLHYQVLTLVLDPGFISAASSGRRACWGKRSALLQGSDSTAPLVSLADTAFPADGSHYRVRQLHTIWEVFGLSVPVLPEPRLAGRIEELVENRNAIAHGRRTPEEVGGRYSTSEIDKSITDIESVATYVVTAMETHYHGGGVRR